MTALLLHGIVKRETPFPPDAPQHVRVAVGGLIALATPASASLLADEGDPPLAEAQTHHELLSIHAAMSDVLPVRFGTIFSSEAALSDGLSRQANALQAALARLSGRVEYVMSLTLAAHRGTAAVGDDEDAEETGRGFLARKRSARDDLRERRARREAFFRAVPDDLRPLIAGQKDLDPSTHGVLAQYALLVDRAAIGPLVQKAQDVARKGAAHGVLVSLRGPGPCYAFVDEMALAVGDNRSKPRRCAGDYGR